MFGEQNNNGRLLGYKSWEAVIKSTCALFGNEKYSKDILNDLKSYIGNDKIYKGLGLREQYGDSYVTILINPSENGDLKYGIRSILMTDKEGFEKSLKESAEFWKIMQVKAGAELIENSLISEVLSKQSDTDETVVIINGYVNNIEELDVSSFDMKSLKR